MKAKSRKLLSIFILVAASTLSSCQFNFNGFGGPSPQFFPRAGPQKFVKGPDGSYIPVDGATENNQAGSTSVAGQGLNAIPWINQFLIGPDSVSLPGLLPGPNSRQGFQLGLTKPDLPHQQCYTPRYEPGHCRHLHHCILPEFYYSFQIFYQYACIIENVYIGVCCPDYRYPSSVIPPVTQAPVTTVTVVPTAGPTATPSHSKGCGLAEKPPKRIVGGVPADPHEWPWMASLLRNNANQYCGGVLITDRHVLTASHCVDGKTAPEITIRLGEYTFGVSGESAHRDFQVVNIKMHEDYNRQTYVNDIAILTLDRPTTFTTDIWPVCLPPEGDDFVGKVATVTGWGTIHYGGPISQTLMEVSIPIWSNAECDVAYKDQDIVDKFLCAGAKEGGKDSCQGDSGGPLLLSLGSQARWVTIGVVSWGIRCAEPGYPGVYTRVNRYLDWIKSNAV